MSLEPPEWVFVWWWLRFKRDPQVMDALPQQERWATPMGRSDYDRYRGEWLEAGAPKVSTTQVVASMGVPTGNPLLDI